MSKSSKAFVGMDVHKESIDWAIAERDGEVRSFGRTGGDRHAVARTVRKLVASGKTWAFVYEAGPCGFGIQRWLKAQGHRATSQTPLSASTASTADPARRSSLGEFRTAR